VALTQQLLKSQPGIESLGRPNLLVEGLDNAGGFDYYDDEEEEKNTSSSLRDESETPHDATLSSQSKPTKSLAKNRIIKVAIAEDEKPILAIYKRILEISGFDVLGPFSNGKELTDYVLSNNNDPLAEPDVIIVDLRMPIMDGLEAARIIRAAKPNIKIILASAYDAPQSSADLFDCILKKPIGKKELLEAVSRVAGD
jgi:CheY-like chemotaxis protein